MLRNVSLSVYHFLATCSGRSAAAVAIDCSYIHLSAHRSTNHTCLTRQGPLSSKASCRKSRSTSFAFLSVEIIVIEIPLRNARQPIVLFVVLTVIVFIEIHVISLLDLLHAE
jgi:hypothetical protein